MGQMYYGGSTEPIDVSDRLLAHMKVVIATKLRRGESFTLSWRDADKGRSTIWLHPAIELRFVFSSPEPEMLDPQLLQQYANEAATAAGLVIDLADVSAPAPASANR